MTIAPRRQPVPLKPDWGARDSAPSDHIVRAVLAEARAELVRRQSAGRDSVKVMDAEQLARKLWPDDRVTPLLLKRDDFGNIVTRASTAAADTSTSGWAASRANCWYPQQLRRSPVRS